MSKQKCSLVYFRKYSDFCFQTEDGFKIWVAESKDNQTEVFVEYCGISRETVIFQQCALAVFRKVSPTDWICGNSGYLVQLYKQKQCVSCQNIENFSK